MKIGAYEFLSMAGDIGSFGDIVEDETRPGIDGHTFRKLGKRGQRFEMQTKMTFGNLSDAKKAVSDYEKLQGTFQVLEDSTGNSYRKTMVHSVRCRVIRIGSATNDDEYMVEAYWHLQRAG